jgi:hypothetical protein
MIAIVLGVSGEIGGGGLSLTGIGALAGVPAMVVSAGVVTGCLANIGAGIRGLLTTGSGSPPPTTGPKPGSADQQGAGKGFLERVKEQARQESNERCVFSGKSGNSGALSRAATIA